MVARMCFYSISAALPSRVFYPRGSGTCIMRHVLRKASHGGTFSSIREKENGREIARPPSA
jgi:hypothetical protein